MPIVSALSAPLLAMYASEVPRPIIEAIEETLTIADPGWRCSSGISARDIWKAPMALTA